MKSRRAAAFLALVAGACSPDFDHLQDGGLRVTRLRLEVGTSEPFDFVAVDEDGNELPCDVALVSRDPDVLFAEKTTSGTTIVRGLAPGKTSAIVYCDGDAIGSIPVEVTTPPASGA